MTRSRRAAARDPSLKVVSDAGYADWLVWKHPSLRGRIAFDVRFELLGTRGAQADRPSQHGCRTELEPSLRGLPARALEPPANPELVRALLAQPGTRVLARTGDVYALERR